MRPTADKDRMSAMIMDRDRLTEFFDELLQPSSSAFRH